MQPLTVIELIIAAAVYICTRYKKNALKKTKKRDVKSFRDSWVDGVWNGRTMYFEHFWANSSITWKLACDFIQSHFPSAAMRRTCLLTPIQIATIYHHKYFIASDSINIHYSFPAQDISLSGKTIRLESVCTFYINNHFAKSSCHHSFCSLTLAPSVVRFVAHCSKTKKFN